MNRVVVKYDIEKLKELGFEVYSNELQQVNEYGFLHLYNYGLLESNDNIYNVVTMYYKKYNIVIFKITFYIKNIDCTKFDRSLKHYVDIDNGVLYKVNANNFDRDCMMYKLHNHNLLELVVEQTYV